VFRGSARAGEATTAFVQGNAYDHSLGSERGCNTLLEWLPSGEAC